MSLRIAITQRVVENQSYYELRDALSHDWIIYLERILSEAVVIPVPNGLKQVEKWCDDLAIDGVLLSNGNDIGEQPCRDTLECALVNYSIKKNIPVLGVCRGFQLINHFFNGELKTQLNCHTTQPHVAKTHKINVIDEAFRQFWQTSTITVNSYHNQGVLLAGLAKELKCFALASDDVVEGLYHPQHRIVAVQWHPERENSNSMTDKQLIRQLFLNDKWWKN